MKLRWTESAKADLIDIGRFIAQDSPVRARRWIKRLRQRAVAAARAPRAGRIVPEFNEPDIREAILGNYRIVYRVAETTVLVLTVFEGHRLLTPLPPTKTEL